jgi:hypothetical protein
VLWPRNQNRKYARTAGAMALLWLAAAAAYGQNTGVPAAVPGGQGEVAFQGYYLGGNGQTFLDTSGTAFHFQQFFPTAGILTGSLEAYGSQNRFQTGENFLELRGLPWGSHYWTFTGGDFRVPATLVEFPFNNIFTPEIDARGVKVQAVHDKTQYTFFYGEETLAAGPRVAYRVMVPQTVMGVSALHRVAQHVMVGARLMQFSANSQAIAANPYLFPPGRTAEQVRTMALEALYTPVKQLKIYAEVSRPDAAGERNLTSVLAGVSWEGAVFTLKANYVYQGILYFPLAGYFAGDRRGPFAEARLHPWKRLELYGSASQYRNNLEGDTSLPFLTSSNAAAGLSLLLPGSVSLTGQLSTIRYSDETPGQGTIYSDDRQISAALSRRLGRHTVQLDWREILLNMQPNPQRQRSSEAGDTYQWKHFSLGGAVRYQQVTGSERLNSLFFRGLAQVNAGPVSAYVNVDVGNDLANQTVFSTEAYRTSMAGISVRLPSRWNLQTEVFRNQLNMTLNQENVFLLQSSGTLDGISPAAAGLDNFTQWSFFFRLSKQIRWGGGLPSEDPARLAVGAAVRLTGSVEGVVHLKNMAGPATAASVPVTLDGDRSAVSGPDGHYVFNDVPEGVHAVALAMEQLPADFDAGDARSARVAVQPHRAVRADFDVLPLAAISGRVNGPEKAPLEEIVIRLLPGSRYTMTAKDGSFHFYNLREGDYQVALDPSTLPENSELQSPAKVAAAVRVGTALPSVDFQFTSKSDQKPVRKVLVQQ